MIEAQQIQRSPLFHKKIIFYIRHPVAKRPLAPAKLGRTPAAPITTLSVPRGWWWSATQEQLPYPYTPHKTRGTFAPTSIGQKRPRRPRRSPIPAKSARRGGGRGRLPPGKLENGAALLWRCFFNAEKFDRFQNLIS